MSPILPWYIAGPLIGLIVPLLLVFHEKQFGISSSYRYLLSGLFAKVPYFNYDRKKDSWQLHFCIGLVISGVLVTVVFPDLQPLASTLSSSNADWNFAAISVYDWSNAVQFFIGGTLVGFGARYANGCTAGHCIMGVSQLAASSLVATASFFIGGWFTSNFILTFIF